MRSKNGPKKKSKPSQRNSKPRVPRTHNGGTWTKSQFFQAIRSALRSKFRYWVPAKQALEDARRPYIGPNKRQKWEYVCAHCGTWCLRKQVEIDHIVECGSLNSLEDIPGFIKRLAPESKYDFQVLCKMCHKQKHKP